MSTNAAVQHPRRLALMAAFQPSAVRRFAIQTITPSCDPRAYPLQSTARRCCFNGYRCLNAIHWRIGDGVEHGYFCCKHVDLWWLDHNCHDFRIIRL